MTPDEHTAPTSSLPPRETSAAYAYRDRSHAASLLASIPVSTMAYDIQYPLADKRRKGEERRREGRWEGSSREEKNRKEVSKLQMPLHCTLSSPPTKTITKHSLESSN